MKFRASQIGKLMIEPRSKSEALSQTTKTFLEELAIENRFGVKKEFSSKYTEKGIICEAEAIALIDPFFDKNEITFENDWITGTPDVIDENSIIDVKCSWNIWTFPHFEAEIPTKDYFYQLQAYMWLTGKSHAKLTYCLIDTPDQLIYNEPLNWHRFGHLARCERIKTYSFDFDAELIEKVKLRCEIASEYYENLIKEL